MTQRTRVIPQNILPKAVLFEGPPGTGKTTSAKLIASEVDIPLIYIGLQNIITKYVGESEKNIAEIFEITEELGKAIIFIDEIDSVAETRNSK
jgi:SpoVK/Ycf46/Vps4 family AAA+-type ATPase